MLSPYKRRHSRWYEVILFNPYFQAIVGLIFVSLLPALLIWTPQVVFIQRPEAAVNTISAIIFAYLGSFFIIRKLRKIPESNPLAYSIPSVLACWAVVAVVLVLSREETYSRPVLVGSLVVMLFWTALKSYLHKRYRKNKFALVPFGRAQQLNALDKAQMITLNQPHLGNRRVNGVIADLHSEELPSEWQRFLAKCTLARIPVYHTQQVIESLTGRVPINHLSENQFGSLLPSPIYSFFKRILDLSLVIISAPVWLPVMLITGLVIKLESDGPMFFKQERVGQADKTFTVYKLRSMCKDSEKNGAQFAQANDARITRVGHFIRKTRLDEIPQFINVIKGDMSLIGPRPEQRVFVDQFEQEIPFYAYRHVVKPGITGWAQVVHGYAADAEDTQVKIEHDFYYIKNFSIWLDILIVAKTIKTILTGFGAR